MPRATEFTAETAAEMGARGGRKRANRLSPERRTEIATIASALRWGKQNGWQPYQLTATNLERINERLMKIAAIEAKAWASGNDDRVLRAIMAALPWERLRMWTEANAGKPGGPSLDAESESIEDEALKRLKESRARREQRLGLQEGETVVEETKDASSESK
jgi:hypothetical protein